METQGFLIVFAIFGMTFTGLFTVFGIHMLIKLVMPAYLQLVKDTNEDTRSDRTVLRSTSAR